MTATLNTSFQLNFTGNSSNETGFHDYACVFLEDPWDVLVSHKIYIFVSLFFVLIGLVGNALSIVVFSSGEMRKVSSNTYLLMLAISDSMYLLSVFFTKILTTLRCMFFHNTEADIFNRSVFFCKFLQYLLDLFSDYSTCLILAFTVERFVAVYLPMKFKEICTVKRARLSCLVILFIVAVFIAPYHILFIGRYHNYNVCTVLMEHESKFTILYMVEALVFRIIPVIVIAVLNVFIIVKVSRVTRDRKRRASSKTTCANNNKKNRAKKEDKSLQLTIMLILVSTSYVLLYIPVLVHFVLYKLQRSKIILTMSQDAMLIAQNYTRVLYVSGFAINFFLYTMSGRVFREQLEMILCDYNKNHARDCYTMAETRETNYNHNHVNNKEVIANHDTDKDCPDEKKKMISHEC